MDELQAQIENLEQKRVKWLQANLVGFCLWYGLKIVDTHFLGEQSHPVLPGIIILGFFLWIISLVLTLRLVRKISSTKAIHQILNDELIELNRFKAWRSALFAVALLQVLIIGIASFTASFSRLLAAELTIFVAVTFSLGGFLYYNTESDA